MSQGNRSVFDFINKIFKSKKYSMKELKEKDSVFLKGPDIVPHEMLNEFSIFFEKYKFVQSAYLAKGFLEAGEIPHYIVGIKYDPRIKVEMERFMDLMAKEIHRIVPKDVYLDFIELNDRKSSINDFMTNCLIPFYLRK